MERQRPDTQSIKITLQTLRQLRIISAMKGERQYQVLERLVQAEYERQLREEEGGRRED